MGPFVVDWMVNPAAVRLRLPSTMKVHSTVQVSRVKPVESDLSHQQMTLPRSSAYTIREILDSTSGVEANNAWSIGKNIAETSGCGFFGTTF